MKKLLFVLISVVGMQSVAFGMDPAIINNLAAGFNRGLNLNEDAEAMAFYSQLWNNYNPNFQPGQNRFVINDNSARITPKDEDRVVQIPGNHHRAVVEDMGLTKAMDVVVQVKAKYLNDYGFAPSSAGYKVVGCGQ